MTVLHDLAYDLRIACQQVSRRVRFDSSAELPPHQVSVLFRLREAPRTPGELAELERVSAPSLTRTANCLVEKGLVDRIDNPADGRSKVLHLTEAGQAALERVAKARDDWMVQRVSSLSESDQLALRRAITIITSEVLV